MFSIESERCKLVHLNIRTEKHGDDDVRAVDLKFERVGPATMIDGIVPGLRQALYRAGQPGDQGDAFAGDNLTALAFPGLRQPLQLDGEYPGYRTELAAGVDLDETLILEGELKKQKVEAVQGGSARHEFTVSTYPDDDDVGRLAAALGHEVVLSLTPPRPAASNDDGEEEPEHDQVA